jgi:hypothetical protein
MKANLVNKANNIKQLRNRNDEIKVEKVIVLDVDLFEIFENNLLDDYDFIKDNVDLMYQDRNDVWHCLFITYSGSDYGILVESEGYHYARYSAYMELNEEIESMSWEEYPIFKKFDVNSNIPY